MINQLLFTDGNNGSRMVDKSLIMVNNASVGTDQSSQYISSIYVHNVIDDGFMMNQSMMLNSIDQYQSIDH